eukprot:3470693-Amphidinium_carterae.1
MKWQAHPMPSLAVLTAAASGSATGICSGSTTGAKAETSSGCTSGGGASCLSIPEVLFEGTALLSPQISE